MHMTGVDLPDAHGSHSVMRIARPCVTSPYPGKPGPIRVPPGPRMSVNNGPSRLLEVAHHIDSPDAGVESTAARLAREIVPHANLPAQECLVYSALIATLCGIILLLAYVASAWDDREA